MGQKARCVARIKDEVSEGRAWLETDELVFRGDDGLRLRVPFRDMRSVEVRDGELSIESHDGRLVLGLGVEAGKWAEKILHPKSLLDKVGVKAGMKVLLLGVEDEEFVADLRERTGDVLFGETSFDRPMRASERARTGLDLAFVAVREHQDLELLAELKRAIKPDGAVWAVFRKGGRTSMRTMCCGVDWMLGWWM